MQVLSISPQSILKIICAGVVWGMASYPYFKALKGEKIENITPGFLTIPLFSYVFANFLLGETLSVASIVIMFLIIIFTGLFMWDFSTKKVNRQGMLLMFASAILYALSYVGFKFGGEGIENIWIIYFWNYLGIALFLLSLLINKHIRKTSLQYFQKSGLKIGGLNLVNETISIVANALVNFVALFYSVAVVQTISNGLQPLFSFLLVFLSYKILPDIYMRKYTKKELLWKLSLCIITFVLLFIFYRIS
jgi:drug/metabolite transporter (DMT)-like permease